ncbi:hypothetical protein BJY01DRAFT_257779 [Aspergillus pseudoustus]|uniref:NADH:flavin oxidoreductase/NADH oxidase N-terminal domain-containing protein n=1 Tax=Aspergillus pseudoustus TaxID=1810923 RepID=A0ABR4JGV0_9EURO
MFEHLLSTLQVGDLQLENRVVFASMTRNRGIVPQSDIHVPYYRERAGVGLITTESVLICPQGSDWSYMPGIYSQDQVDGWKAVTDAVHDAGGLIFCQLLHPGRIAHPDTHAQRQTGQAVVAPSPIAARGGKFRNVPGGPGYVVPSEIADPEEILDLFEEAARGAKEAGFDGLQLHHANGYLPMQFLEAHSNTRTDAWGGSIENRIRFTLGVLERMSRYFPYNRISIKIAPCGGYNDMGELDASGQPSIEAAKATYIPFCKALAKLGLAYIEVVRFFAPFDPVIDGKGRGVDWDVISELRDILRGTPLFGNTAFTPEEAETYIREDRMDGVAIGRPLIYDQDYVGKLKAGEQLYQEQRGDEFWW